MSEWYESKERLPDEGAEVIICSFKTVEDAIFKNGEFHCCNPINIPSLGIYEPSTYNEEDNIEWSYKD